MRRLLRRLGFVPRDQYEDVCNDLAQAHIDFTTLKEQHQQVKGNIRLLGQEQQQHMQQLSAQLAGLQDRLAEVKEELRTERSRYYELTMRVAQQAAPPAPMPPKPQPEPEEVATRAIQDGTVQRLTRHLIEHERMDPELAARHAQEMALGAERLWGEGSGIGSLTG